MLNFMIHIIIINIQRFRKINFIFNIIKSIIKIKYIKLKNTSIKIALKMNLKYSKIL